MRAILVHRLGPPEVLELADVPRPRPGPGQILVHLHATGVNFSDTERRRGVYKNLTLPWTPGTEGAGRVVAVGPDTDANLVDRRVAFWAMPPAVSGTYAEYAVAPAGAPPRWNAWAERRMTMTRSHGFATTCRSVLCLLVPVFLCALAASGAEAPKDEKAAGTVDVHLHEYAVEMPKTLPAGPTTFVVYNDGGKTHSFKIEGPGLEELLSAPVPPRASGTLQVTLRPGEYKIYCPIGSHELKGMTMKLTVTAKQGG